MPQVRVVALLAAYNEADIVGCVVRDLVEQDIQVYFLDDGSTDGTIDAVAPFVGHGVLRIERLRTEGAGSAAPFDWGRILRRKEALAAELDADWFIHHDADEFRESPWEGCSLRGGIQIAETMGFNAIDFLCLNFRPTHDRFRPGDDPREAFPFFEHAAAYDRLRVNCWKRTQPRVDLASSGGHDVRFDARRVFPWRFLLRHYPIRSQQQGERKVFEERRPRFLAAERDRGWHVQYDQIEPGAVFLQDPRSLIRFDPRAARSDPRLEPTTEDLSRQVVELRAAHATAATEVESLRSALAARDHALEQARASLDAACARAADLENRLAESMRLYDEMRCSKTWRWTEPVRATVGYLRGRR